VQNFYSILMKMQLDKPEGQVGPEEQKVEGEVEDLRASVYCQMATCKRD
jgi:hypothetical protein